VVKRGRRRVAWLKGKGMEQSGLGGRRVNARCVIEEEKS
jgi:hypothetical protein